jgi:hypothetical protein
MTLYKEHTALIPQMMPKILGGIALIFAMLLSFVSPLWALQVSPSALTFSATSGGTDPSPQTVVLSSTRSRERSWTATENAPWITITPSSGTIATETDIVSVRATAAGLAAGSYSANVTITETSQSGHIRRTILPVTLSVTGAGATPAIQLSVSSLTFSGTAGGANPAPTSFSISNTGGGTLTWTASDTSAWLILSPASGTNTGTVTASITANGLAAGTYSTTVTVSAPGVTAKTILVNLTVNPATSSTGYTVSPSSMSYTGTVGGPNVVAGVTITNTGSTALTVTWQDTINWLIATSGDTVSIAPGGTATITHTASTNGLASGTYSGTATLSGGGVTKQVPMTFTLTTSTTMPTISLAPASLAFTGIVGGSNPTTQTFTVTKAGASAITWTASDNAAWLTLSPSTGTATAAVTTSVNLAGLAAGTHNGTISVAVAGSSNTPQSIPVSLTVTASTATSATLTWTANTESDLAGYKVYSGTQSGVYGPPISVGKVTSHILTNLTKGTTYFFTITAYDTAGNESASAPELSKSIY